MEAPLLLAVVQGQAGEFAEAALHVDPLSIDQGCASGAWLEFVGVLLGEGLAPQLATSASVEAMGGFLAAGIVQVDKLLSGNHHTRIAVPDGFSPQRFGGGFQLGRQGVGRMAIA